MQIPPVYSDSQIGIVSQGGSNSWNRHTDSEISIPLSCFACMIGSCVGANQLIRIGEEAISIDAILIATTPDKANSIF